MQDRPTAAELLADIAELLEGEALQATSGALQHRIRVAGNLCRILEREVSEGPAHDAREVELLAGLLDEPAGNRDAATLCQAVIERLDAGADASFEQDTWRAAVAIVRSKLAIAKPGHDRYDFAGEQRE
jgi:hypothetical protein